MKYAQLLLINAICILSLSAFADTPKDNPTQIQGKLEQLEKSFNGKIGAYALDTSNNQVIAYRADERFPVQSTMKLIGVAALLKQSDHNDKLLQEKITSTITMLERNLRLFH